MRKRSFAKNSLHEAATMTPLDDFVYLINNYLLGEEPTIEDFILLIGTVVAFIAFVLWCCFPIQPKEDSMPFACKSLQHSFATQNYNSYKEATTNYCRKYDSSYHYCT